VAIGSSNQWDGREMGLMAESSFRQAGGDPEIEPAPRKPIRCDAEHCGLPAICSVDLRFFCVGHFISHCYDRLTACSAVPFRELDETTACAIDRFLQECSQQAAALVRPIRGIDNLERARLFDIFLWASEVASKRSALTRPDVIDAAYRINRRGV
jgi:hypothetical protein